MTSLKPTFDWVGCTLLCLAMLFLGIAIGMGIEAGYDTSSEPLQFGGSIRIHLQSTEASK